MTVAGFSLMMRTHDGGVVTVRRRYVLHKCTDVDRHTDRLSCAVVYLTSIEMKEERKAKGSAAERNNLIAFVPLRGISCGFPRERIFYYPFS